MPNSCRAQRFGAGSGQPAAPLAGGLHGDGVAADLQRRDLRLEQVLFGCRFPNRGFGGGFDKNGVRWHLGSLRLWLC